VKAKITSQPRRAKQTVAKKRDHRVDVAELKRKKMRALLIEATLRVHADYRGRPPVIEDVINEAQVSRGSFYKYFNSVDEAVGAVGHELSDQMTTDILPIYDVLKQPWQRFAVGFRVFLVRAMLDPAWAGFVTRMEAWSHDSLVAKYMSQDLKDGLKARQFSFVNLACTTDLLMGASAAGIQALRRGVDDPQLYIDAAVSLGLRALGCDDIRSREGVAFSALHLQRWLTGELGVAIPRWALQQEASRRSNPQ
jgi:AcrR family transcriptional regulator